MKIKFDSIPDEIYAIQVPTPSLGDHTYLVVVDDVSALIDPQLDIDRFESLIADSGTDLRWVLDTHVHNDYVSGAKLIAEKSQAKYVLPVDSGAAFEHTVISDGESIPIGRCILRAIHTPGHTPHHMSYVLELSGESDSDTSTIAAFTGGSMLVGAVGRSDLLGPDFTEGLAYDQYRSVNHLAAELPSPVKIGPTHGSGSFCSATPASDNSISTIGIEKKQNPALIASSADAFVSEQLAGYGLYPSYYANMGPINRAGAVNSDPVSPPTLTPHEITDLAGTSVLIDLRDKQTFAGGHIEDSINVPMSTDAGAYVGWVVPWNADIVLITPQMNDATDILRQLHRIGIENVRGIVPDGLHAWEAEGRPLSRYRAGNFQELMNEKPANILDARDAIEFASFSLPGAINVHFSQISAQSASLDAGTVWVHCQSGYRAAIAASQLARSGRDVVLVDDDIGNAKHILET